MTRTVHPHTSGAANAASEPHPEAGSTRYVCSDPLVWGIGQTPAIARQNALVNRLPSDKRGPYGKPVQYLYAVDDRVEVFTNWGVEFVWADDVPPPRLVELRDGRGSLLPLEMAVPLNVKKSRPASS
jgi:hypothetical protein